MSRPALGSFAEELYARLAPFHAWSSPGGQVTDEDGGWPLLIYWGSIAARWQEIEDLARDSDERPGWSLLVDIDNIPDKGLPYLAQWVGKELLPGTTPAQQRERIRSTDGFDRGTPAAFAAAAKLHLTGPNPSVIINERLGGDPWHVGVVTKTTETPDPAQTFRDLQEQKPWGMIIDYVVIDAWGYDAIKVAFDDYGEIKLNYPDYEGLKDNDPPA